MNKTKIELLIVAVILIVGGYIMLGGGSGSSVNGNVVAGGEVQDGVLGMKDFNYYPNTVTVKVNQPVRVSLDESVFGCFRDFTVREFGVHEYLATPQDTVEFVPNKKGTFSFACSMGMGVGRLIVE